MLACRRCSDAFESEEMKDIERLRIVIVGAGNLATSLACAMVHAGLSVVQIYSRTDVSACRLAKRVGCASTDDLGKVADADLYVIAVTDTAIAEVIPPLAGLHRGAVFCHTAGSVPMSVFGAAGVTDYGVLYPMQTFSKARIVDFAQVQLFVEYSSPRAGEVMTAVAGRLTRHVHEADTATRCRLHIAAVFTCNFANRLYALAERILADGGLPFGVMLPLIDETVAKVHRLSPSQAQTGPASRGDMAIVTQHLDMLEGDEEMRQIYEMMTKSIINGRNQS